MAGAWRNRYLAPFYALAISFVLVLLLGFTLEPPEPPPPPVRPDPESSITFSAADEFPVKSAIVSWGDEQHNVESPAELARLKTNEPVFVCAQLDKGWEAVGADKLGAITCWGPLEPREPGADITIRVKEPK